MPSFSICCPLHLTIQILHQSKNTKVKIKQRRVVVSCLDKLSRNGFDINHLLALVLDRLLFKS